MPLDDRHEQHTGEHPTGAERRQTPRRVHDAEIEARADAYTKFEKWTKALKSGLFIGGLLVGLASILGWRWLTPGARIDAVAADVAVNRAEIDVIREEMRDVKLELYLSRRVLCDFYDQTGRRQPRECDDPPPTGITRRPP